MAQGAVHWRVAVAHRPPFIFVNSAAGANGTALYSGMLIELLNKVISTQTDFKSITYTLYTSPTNAGGTLNANGIWSGEAKRLFFVARH